MGKGSNAENELVEFFWEKDFAVLRSPGSGSVQRASPDVFATDGQTRIAVELKSHPEPTDAFFKSHEIPELSEWGNRCNADCYVGVKPDMRSYDQWYFISVDEVHETDGGNYSIRSCDLDKCLSREDLLK